VKGPLFVYRDKGDRVGGDKVGPVRKTGEEGKTGSGGRTGGAGSKITMDRGPGGTGPGGGKTGGAGPKPGHSAKPE
jgi:hypothetical protein